jgi:hypothetical protein
MVKKMLKNACDQFFPSSFKRNRGWNVSLTWPSKDLIEDDGILSKDKYLECEADAELKVSQIQDPLWQRVCDDLLKMLGPLAFKDLWKIKLINVSPEGKKAYFSSPNETLALTLQQYHFVIIGALKKFYPFLSSLEVEISEEKMRHIPANQSSKISTNLHQQFN